MKTNLGAIFGTNGEMETEGKWFPIGDKTEFKMRRMGGKNQALINKLSSQYFKPYVRQIRAGALSPEIEHEVYTKVFIKTCMVDWKELKDDEGKDIPYSEENAMELFTATPDLLDYCVEIAKESDSFKDDLGNS